MASFIINLAAAILLGALAGMGLGGGSILMLWLTLYRNLPLEDARFITLVFYLCSAGTVSSLRLKGHALPLKKIWPAIVAGGSSAVIASCLVSGKPEPWVKVCFGILLIFTGIRECFYHPRKPR